MSDKFYINIYHILFFQNVHISIASYQIVCNPSGLKLTFLGKNKREDDQ